MQETVPVPSFSDAVLNATVTLVILSMIIERALAVIFDMEKLQPIIKRFDLKPIVAIIVSVLVCAVMGFNLPQVLASTCVECNRDGFQNDGWKELGIVLTGLMVAGGSAGAVKLFQDVLGFRRSTRDSAKELAEIEREAAKAEADARLAKAKAETKVADVQNLMATAVTAAGSSADPTTQSLISKAFARRKIEDGYHRSLIKVMQNA